MTQQQQSGQMTRAEKVKSARRLERASVLTHILGLGVTIGIAALIFWATRSPLDVVSIVQGSIVPASKVQQVQHLEGGIIEEINVEEGQTVQAGQPLMILSQTSSASDAGEIELRILSQQVDIARLEATIQGADTIAFPPGFVEKYPSLTTSSTNLFQAAQASHQSALQAQESEVEAKRQEVAEIRTRLKNTGDRYVLVKEQVEIGETLIRQQLSNRYDQIERLKEANGLKSKLDEDKILLERARAGLAQAKGRLEQIALDYQREIQHELSATRQHFEEFSKRAEKFQDNLERTILRAPVNGVIKRLHAVSVGGVIRAGDTVMEIVPANDSLIVEARLPPQDVGFIQIGQSAFVQLESAEATRLSKLNGVVRHISPDSIITNEGEAFYLVNILVEKDHFTKGDQRINLFPGMIVSAGIVLGQRSVLEYILSPFMNASTFTFSEI